MDSSSISSTMADTDVSIADDITEVKFEASEFGLNFFDTPEDSMTQVAFSNPNSVDSSTSPTPEPHLPLTPTALHAITSSSINQQQHQKMAQPAIANVKNGKASWARLDVFWIKKRDECGEKNHFSIREKQKFTSLCSLAAEKLHHDRFSFRSDSGFLRLRARS